MDINFITTPKLSNANATITERNLAWYCERSEPRLAESG